MGMKNLVDTLVLLLGDKNSAHACGDKKIIGLLRSMKILSEGSSSEIFSSMGENLEDHSRGARTISSKYSYLQKRAFNHFISHISI